MTKTLKDFKLSGRVSRLEYLACKEFDGWLRNVAKEHIDVLKKELKELLKRTKKVSPFDDYEEKIKLGILAARIVAKMEWINEFFDLKEDLEHLEEMK